MLRLLITYLIVASLCGGYLSGMNQFVPTIFQLSGWEITWRSAIWPYSMGQFAAGWTMGDVDLPEPKVETEEKYEAPKKEDSSIGVHEGALSV